MYLKNNKATIFWALLVAVLSFLPGNKFPKVELSNIDLAVHFFFYSVFTLLLIIGNVSQVQKKFFHRNPVIVSLIISISFGAIVELIQGTEFVSRSAEFADFLANSAGSLIGWVLFIVIYGPTKNFTTWNKKKPPTKILENNHHNTSS